VKLLDWYIPLEEKTSLDDIVEQWDKLLEQCQVTAGYEDPRYADAVLSFLARSSLPSNLKLAAVLAKVPSLDFDLRLSIGALSDQLEPYWKDLSKKSSMVEGSGACLDVSSSDQWLLGYLHGRLTELREAMREDRGDFAVRSQAFWNRYLVMCSRWADLDGVRVALENGAGRNQRDCTAITVAAEGVEAGFGSAYYVEGRSNTDYFGIIDLLLSQQTTIAICGGAALQSAASVGNVEILEFLLSRGADIHASDDGALIGAAVHGMSSTIEWLLEHGANAQAANNAPLIAAVSSLDVSSVEALLNAGANIHVDDELPLRRAFCASPVELFDGDGHDFINQRGAMIVVLMNRGAALDSEAVFEAIKSAPDAEKVLKYVINHGGGIAPIASQMLNRLMADCQSTRCDNGST